MKNVKIEIKGDGYNTDSLVEFTSKFVKKEEVSLEKDEVWVVFDKDSFDKDFDKAINKAKKKGFNVAYSNESFELWFLLHFNFVDSAIGRNDYNRKLTENYRRVSGDKKYKYKKDQKNTELLIDLIKEREKDAIRNAKKLLKQFSGEKSFLKKNPSTTVCLLVERLNELKKIIN